MNYRMTVLAVVCLFFGAVMLVPMAVLWLGSFVGGGWPSAIFTTVGVFLFFAVLAFATARIFRRR